MRVYIFVAFFFFVPFWACKGEELPNITDIKPEYKDAIQLNYDYNSILDYEEYNQCIEKTDLICSKTEPAIKYLYITNEPVVFSDNEDYFAITKNTRTYEIDGIKKIKIYGSDAFINEGGIWYETGIGYAQKAVWDSVVADTLVKARFDNWNPFKIYRVNAQDVYYSGTGDGCVTAYGNVSWNDTHDKTTGQYADDGQNFIGDPSWGYGVGLRRVGANEYIINRGFLPFDTSSIADDAVATSASLFIYPKVVNDDLNEANADITIVQTTQPDPTNLTTADIELCGAVDNPDEGTDDRLDLTGLSTSAYAEIPLNALGLSWIDLEGYTMLGLRDMFDCSDTAPDSNGVSALRFSSSENTGTGEDPYLEITLSDEEPPTGTSTPIIYNTNCTPDITNDLSLINACSFLSSTTGVTYTNYHIPFLIWLVLIIPLWFIYDRLIKEVIIIFRRTND